MRKKFMTGNKDDLYEEGDTVQIRYNPADLKKVIFEDIIRIYGLDDEKRNKKILLWYGKVWILSVFIPLAIAGMLYGHRGLIAYGIFFAAFSIIWIVSLIYDTRAIWTAFKNYQ